MICGCGSANPTEAYENARRRLRKAEENYANAESDLIKARREMKEAERSYHSLFRPLWAID